MAAVGSGVYAGRDLNLRNLWLYVPALFFAVMVGVRADEWLLFYNVVMSLGLGALALHYSGARMPFDLTTTVEQVGNVIATSIRSCIDMPLGTLVVSRHWFGARRESGGDGSRTVAVLRGLALTLPVLLVFGALLGSADAVFANYLPSLAWLENLNVEDFIGRAFLMGVLSWFAVGAITYANARDWAYTPPKVNLEDASERAKDDTIPESTVPMRDSLPKPPKRDVPRALRLSMIEGGMLLGGVSLLFGAFVLVQFVYLFGGQGNIGVDGLTYAEYARRGFFELVAVAVLTMALLQFADRFVVRDGKRETLLFRVLGVVIIALVGVMLLSAARRMALYTDEFGLTRLRLWTSVFMAWLAVLFVVLVASLFRARQNVFSFGLVLVAIGFFGTMNLLNPDARIAAHNIDRALAQGEELDICYLDDLSVEAVPAIIERFEVTNDPALGEMLLRFAAQGDAHLSGVNGQFGGYNQGWVRSIAALDAIDTQLTPFEGRFTLCAQSYDIGR
ncbi:MAG: DUF4173 domain-containing protein [Chloroflexota bacterium]